ncbi:MAG TPA: hypothetical protein DEB31_05820 [Clostridiales bacterium]|nr:hypothetical protein [Clostridiales bacterium]
MCEAREALDSYSGPAQEKSAAIATGADMAPFMRRIAGWAQERHDVRLRIYEVRNDFFGQTVTVAGLLTGRDLIGQLKGKVREGPLLLPATMFRENTETTLDGLALEDIARELRVPCRKVAVDGYSLIGQLMGEENGETTGSDCRQA